MTTTISDLPTRRVDQTRSVEIKALRDDLGSAKSAQQNASALLNSLMNTSSDGLITASSDGIVTRFNPICQRIFGYPSRDVVGKSVTMLLAAGCASELGEYFKKAQFRDPTSTLVSVRKVTGVSKSGEKLSVELSFGNVIAADGDLSYVISLRDVSRKGELRGKVTAAEAELEEARERLSALSDQYVAAASDFQDISYLVSHDLRAPVVNVVGFGAEVERLIAKVCANEAVQKAAAEMDDLRELLEVQMPEVLSFMRMSGEKAQRRFDAVVQLSRLGARPLRPRSVNLAQFAQDTIDAHIAPEFRDNFSLTLSSAPALHVDERAFGSVLENVLDNALQAAHPRRRLRVQIGATWDDKHLTVLVQDNGVGMEPEDTARVFKLFQRAGDSPVTNAGCGLAYCHRLVSRLGGKIWCDSESGDGAIFSIRLPFTPAEDAKPDVTGERINGNSH